MATNHTQNYQLNLWEPTDRFLRTEFNENSQKIDAALKAEADARSALAAAKADTSALNALSQTVSALLQPAPLLDFTLAANTDLIAVPITDEYRQKYRRLLVHHDLKVSGSKSCIVRFRTSEDKIANVYPTIYPRISSTAIAEQEAFSFLILELAAPVALFFNYSYRKYRGATQDTFTEDRYDHYCAISSQTWSQIPQLEFKIASNYSFDVGSQVRMYGLL